MPTTPAQHLQSIVFDALDYTTAREACYLTSECTVISTDWLIELSQLAQARYIALVERHPPGTFHGERDIMRDLVRDAEDVALWMLVNGMATAKHVGPFGPRLPEKGATITIRAGARAQYTGTVKVSQTKRAMHVKLRFADRGYIRREGHEVTIKHAQLWWSGSGGYWRSTDAFNLVAVAAQTTSSAAMPPAVA